VLGAALSVRWKPSAQLAVSSVSPDLLGAIQRRGADRSFAFGRLRLRKRSSSPHMTLRDVMLSRQLKEGTKTSHNAAENTKFIGQFLKGVLDPDQYRKLITDFYYVYDTMEKRIRETQDPTAGTLKQWQASLDRTAFLEEDLAYYYGLSWRDKIVPSEACNKYCSRINEIAASDPYLLIAHHYARYIGDLSGGQILKGIAVKALNQANGEGLRFYDFPTIDDAKAFKKQYREVLDDLGLDEDQRTSLIREANYAFSLNMDIFDELQGDVYSMASSFWGILWNRIRAATSEPRNDGFGI
jgi:heme oxygenase